MLRAQVLELLGGTKVLANRRRSARIAGPRVIQKRLKGTAMRSVANVGEEPAAYGASSAGALSAAQPPFRINAIDNLARRLDLPADTLMTILGITGRTSQRRRQQGVLAVEESDRLYRMARVVERAIEVLGSEEGARLWLRRPQAILEGSAAIALLGSESGSQAVEQQLGRIEYGDLY